MRTGLVLLLAGGLLAPCGVALGQASAAKAPAYDVTSIKLNKSGENRTSVWIEGPTFTATNLPLKRLIESAYNIKASLISGIPDSMAGLCFDVTSKMLDADPEALKKMRDKDKMQLLFPVLLQRFHLKAHTETRTLPIYELQIASGGSKLKQVTGDGDGTVNMNGREMILKNMDAGRLAGFLSDVVQRKVIDKTGLKGSYDLDLTWSPEGADQNDGPPVIFTAVQEQLGLKLVPAKGPVEVLVVDSIEMPTEN
jgi:uncharacterized protein (TIGR03435 family)